MKPPQRPVWSSRSETDPELAGRGGGSSGGGGPLAGYYALRNVNWLAHLFEQSNFVPSKPDYLDCLSNAKSYLQRLASFTPSNVSSLAKLALEDSKQYEHSYLKFAESIRTPFQALPWRLLVIPQGVLETSSGFDAIVVRGDQNTGAPPSTKAKAGRIKIVPKVSPEQQWDEFKNAFSKLFVDPPKGTESATHGKRSDLDKILTSTELFYELQIRGSDYPCLILQLDSALGSVTCLEDVFPAFETALANANRWPGVLIWKLDGERSFFPLSEKPDKAIEALRWMLSSITKQPRMTPSDLLARYVEHRFYPAAVGETECLSIIHTSDMHLGNAKSNRRLTTIKNRIQQLASECRSNSVVPIVTGDLMDSPSPTHLDSVLDYIHFLDNLGFQRPVVVLGNHDVRRLGILERRTEEALRLYMSPIVWFDQAKVGLLCFNSVRAGQLARGFVDENEFIALGNELDRHPKRASDYMLIALLHHHPTPVEIPEWYVNRWYQRWMGSLFEKTIELKNAEVFLNWCSTRGVAAILHGHKHIPRVDLKDQMAIIGCGSTVGKVETATRGQTYMAINLLQVDVHRRRISCRVRVERVVGGGLTDIESHEILYRNSDPIIRSAFHRM